MSQQIANGISVFDGDVPSHMSAPALLLCPRVGNNWIKLTITATNNIRASL